MAKERTEQAKKLLNPPEPIEQWTPEKIMEMFNSVMEAITNLPPDITDKSKAIRTFKFAKKALNVTKNKGW